MDLKPFLKSLPDVPAREAFALRCGSTIGHLTNVANGHKSCSTELAVCIEAESGRQVTRQELCPDNWRARWPELVESAARSIAADQGA